MYKSKVNDADLTALMEIMKTAVESNSEFKLRITGIKDAAHFELSKRIAMMNSFNPIFFGSIEDQPDKFKISGYFGVSRYTSKVINVIYCVLAFFILVSCLSTDFGSPIEMTLNSGGTIQKIYAPWWTLIALSVGILSIIIIFQTLCFCFQKYKHNEILNAIKKLL